MRKSTTRIGPFFMNLIATLACGLLLGTAFIVILPEGIEMLLHGLETHGDHGDEEEQHSDEHDEEEEDHEDHDEHEEHEEAELNGPMVGLAIIAGIIFMMLVHSFGPEHEEAEL